MHDVTYYVVTYKDKHGNTHVIAVSKFPLDHQTIEALIALDELSDIIYTKKQGGKMPTNDTQNVQEETRTDWNMGQVCPNCGCDKLDEIGICGSCKYDAQLGSSPVNCPAPQSKEV